MHHPMRTLLYEFFFEPVTQRLERMWALFGRAIAQRRPAPPALITGPTGPAAPPTRRPRPKT